MKTVPLSEKSIQSGMDRYKNVFTFHIYPSVASTNDTARDMAIAGQAEGAVVLAERQTRGRGRQGRPFFSPEGTGIYMSLLLRPDPEQSRPELLTTAAAVAVAKAIEEVTGKQAGIKWVNDVFIDGKKVCGILTEGAFDGRAGRLAYAVVGIGVNVCPPENGFPGELAETAAGLSDGGNGDVRGRLIGKILENYWGYYKTLPEKAFYADYKERSILTGKPVAFQSGQETGQGMALDIDPDFALIVRDEKGHIRRLISGEARAKLA